MKINCLENNCEEKILKTEFINFLEFLNFIEEQGFEIVPCKDFLTKLKNIWLILFSKEIICIKKDNCYKKILINYERI